MSDDKNPSQEGTADLYDQLASAFDRVGPSRHANFGQRLVDLAELTPELDVLDVATGRGASLFPAAHQVGLRGHVVGIDLSSEMVKQTQDDVRRADLQHVEIHQMNAEQLDFPDASFDRVLCGFALWFFPDPPRALAEFFRVLRPGGRVSLSVYAHESPYLRMCLDILRHYSSPDTNERQWMQWNTSPQLAGGLTQAGFTESQIIAEENEFVYADEETVWSALWAGALRARLEKLRPLALGEIKAQLFHQLQALKHADGIHTWHRALFALGYKP